MSYAILEQKDGKYKIVCFNDEKQIGVAVYCNKWSDVMIYLNMINRGVAA